MNRDYPTNTKTLTLGACAFAAAILLTSGAMLVSASAADYQHGTLTGRNIYGCVDLKHYIDTAHHYEDVSKREGKKTLEEHIKDGTCKVLQKGARAEVKGSYPSHAGLKVQIEGESRELWISATHFKHN